MGLILANVQGFPSKAIIGARAFYRMSKFSITTFGKRLYQVGIYFDSSHGNMHTFAQGVRKISTSFHDCALKMFLK